MRKNVIVLMTDQERHPVHWPEGWVEEHLPSQARLKKHGISYERAYTAASMCSPSRAAIVTSQFSPVNNVTVTFNTAPPASPTLPKKSALANLASLIEDNSNYSVVWKGKWHLSYALDGYEAWSAADIPHLQSSYGPTAWTPPDSGNADRGTYDSNKTFALSTLGGGYAANDRRCWATQGQPLLDIRRTVVTKHDRR
jgi:choline-sulfatase